MFDGGKIYQEQKLNDFPGKFDKLNSYYFEAYVCTFQQLLWMYIILYSLVYILTS